MNDLSVVSPEPKKQPSGSHGRMDPAMDKLTAMLRQEEGHYGPCVDYLSFVLDDAELSQRECVHEAWRRRICEWSFEVVDHFGFDREAVSIALSYIDRVTANTTVATGKPVPRRQFQLFAVTSLYLALKVHGLTGADVEDGSPRKLRIDSFVELSRGEFPISTIETMERYVMASLDWHLHPPTTVSYISTMIDLFPDVDGLEQFGHFVSRDSVSRIFETARYLTELAVCVSKFTFLFQPSLVAYAAIICGIDGLADSVQVPKDVQLEFLANLAHATSLTPAHPDVRQCCPMLKEICPSMFEPQVPPLMAGIVRSSSVSSTASNDITLGASGKVSPVSVVESPSPLRKRSRGEAM